MLHALVALVLCADGGVPPATSQTWQAHPDVVAARAVFNEVRAALDAGKLSVRKSPACEEFSELSGFTDATGTARMLVRRFGSSDSSQHVDAYYDDTGRLRFVFVRVDAVPSAWVEARWWIDEAGRVAWKSRASGGEGPTYYATELAPYFVKDPTAFVQQHTRCGKR